MRSQATIDGGGCGIVTTVIAEVQSARFVSFTVISPCERVQALALALSEHGAFDLHQEMDWHAESPLGALARASLGGSSVWCPVPLGLRKCTQMACGLSVPEEMRITTSWLEGEVLDCDGHAAKPGPGDDAS